MKDFTEKFAMAAPMILILVLLIFVGTTIYSQFTEGNRHVNECKSECNKLGLNYHNTISGSWNKRACICLDNDNEPITIYNV